MRYQSIHFHDCLEYRVATGRTERLMWETGYRTARHPRKTPSHIFKYASFFSPQLEKNLHGSILCFRFARVAQAAPWRNVINRFGYYILIARPARSLTLQRSQKISVHYRSRRRRKPRGLLQIPHRRSSHPLSQTRSPGACTCTFKENQFPRCRRHRRHRVFHSEKRERETTTPIDERDKGSWPGAYL